MEQAGMRIVFLLSSLGAGGAERVATTLCNAWCARGDTVVLIPTYSAGGQPFYELAEGVKTISLADVAGIRRKTPRSYAQRLRALRRLISESVPDVIVSFLPNVNVAAILATAGLGIPLIICERNDPDSRSAFGFWEICSRLTYRFADMFAVQTEAVAGKVHRRYPGLRRVRAVPNPLSEGLAAFRAEPAGARRILLSIGRLAEQKRMDRLIDAFSELAPRFGDWDLHIYGEGPLRQALDARIGELGLQGRAFLKGRTGEPWTVMAGADAFAMTSKHEGFPNALLEAMGIGLPCVVTDCPSGPREITRDGRDALLVAPGDRDGLVAALARVMGDAAFRARLGAQARESVLGRYSLASVIDHWDRLFREVRPAEPT
jgi:glycosyltransferase involved in cell wall biosynthesis